MNHPEKQIQTTKKTAIQDENFNGKEQKMGEYLTVTEAAKILRMTKQSVWKMCQEGKIKAKKLPGSNKWLINSDELKKILP